MVTHVVPLKQVFDHMMCKSPDVPLKDELLCGTSIVYGSYYFLHMCHATADDS